MKPGDKGRRKYEKPAIIRELELETRAGTPLIIDPLNIPGSETKSDGG